MTDRELLTRYVTGNDQVAFAELVSRHGDWVYSCAKRLMRHGDMAEDVAQAVFVLLAQKAGKFSRRTHLAGWLFRATQYCAQEAMRSHARRQKHEREAAMRQQMAAGGEGANWEEIWPVLDAAVQRLRAVDREAVLLRFYQGMSVSELAAAIGTGEEAAKKRVQRAVEKLRGALASKGVMAGVGALGVVMAERVTEAAPAGLAKAAIVAAGGGGARSAGVIAKGAMKMLVWTKLKMAAGVVMAAGLLAGAAVATQPSRGQPATLPVVRKEAAPAVQDEPVLGPKDTLVAFQRDVVALKRQAVRQVFAASGADEEHLADAMTDFYMAAQALQNELVVRFPGETRAGGLPHMNPNTFDKAIEKIDGDAASVAVADSHTPILMKRVNGRWRFPIRQFSAASSDADVQHLIATAEQETRMVQAALEVARRDASFDEIMRTYKNLEEEAKKASQTGPTTKASGR